MRLTKEKCVAFMVAILMLLACVCGCAPSVPAETDVPEHTVIEGKVSPEAVTIVPGDNSILFTSEEPLPKDVEKYAETSLVNYGWGECYPTKLLRKDDNTLEISFVAEAAPEDMNIKNMSFSGMVMIAGAESTCIATATFPIDMPNLFCEQSVAKGASKAAFWVTLEGATLREAVSADDIVLSEAFAGMQVADIRREDDYTLALTLEGEVLANDETGLPYTEGGVALLPGSTDAAVAAYGEVPVMPAGAYLQNVAFSDPKTLTVSVHLENCLWSETISPEQMTLSGAFENAAVRELLPVAENPALLKVVLDIPQKQCDGTGSIVFAADAVDAGKAVGVDVDFDQMGFFASVENLGEKDGRVTLRIVAEPHGLMVVRVPEIDELTLGGEFEQGRVDSAVGDVNGALAFSISFPAEKFRELKGYGGVIFLPVDSVKSEYASMDDFDVIVNVGRFKEAAAGTADLFAADAAEGMLLLAAPDGTALMADGDTMNKLCEFAKDGLATLARGGVTYVGGLLTGKLLGWLGITDDPTGEQLNAVLGKLDALSKQVNQLEQSIQTLIDAVDSATFKEQMRDIQKNVLNLKSIVSGYLAAFGELAKLEPGSDEYQKELAIFADMVNNSPGIDFHAETYSLGEKILSDAAGTAAGALQAHYDRVMTQYDWENQTYEERERFYLYSVGTYTQAAMLDGIALEYIIETSTSSVLKATAQTKLDDLRAQMKQVSALAETYAVKRLKPEYDRNLRADVILSKNIKAATFNDGNPLVSRADVFSLINNKLDRGIQDNGYRFIEMNGTGEFDLADVGLLTEAQANEILKHSGQKTLLEELKSAGFTVPSGCPDAAVLSQVKLEKQFHNSGSKSYYLFMTYLKLFTDKAAWEYLGKYAVTSKSCWDNYFDYSRTQKMSDRYGSYGEVKAAQVTVMKDSEDLYVVNE